jgi:assimilatory nitrate reductase electron transfer subunit
MKHTVVVGFGMAGARVVGELRARDSTMRITVFGAEAHAAYNRIMLTDLLDGKTDEDAIAFPHDAHAADVRLGSAVTGIDRSNMTVTACDGSTVRYDTLLLATGATPYVPPIKGLMDDKGQLAAGVVCLRTLEDCRRILRLSRRARKIIVLGGGTLGIEAACALAGQGTPVEILHAADRLMDRHLDATASGILVHTLRELGITTRLDALVCEVRRNSGLVVRLADDTEIGGDLLVVACGVKSNTRLAQAAKLSVNKGVIVDDQLRTADASIYAIGDCAEHAGVVAGLVAPAWEQARVVADAITGADPVREYRPAPPVTRLTASGVDIAVMGETLTDIHQRAEKTDVVQFVDSARGDYKKIVIRDDRVVGATLIGDNPTAGSVIQAFDRRTSVPADRLSLLFRTNGVSSLPAGDDLPGEPSPHDVICMCNGVTTASVIDSWSSGARSLERIAQTTQATTGCGSCRSRVDDILRRIRRRDNV